MNFFLNILVDFYLNYPPAATSRTYTGICITHDSYLNFDNRHFLIAFQSAFYMHFIELR